MSKRSENRKKSNKEIILIFIAVLVGCYVVGFALGILSAKAEGTAILENIITAVKTFVTNFILVAFMIVSALGILIPLTAFIKCNGMYQKLQSDRDNDELWDALEDQLNHPMILSNVFSMINLCLFFCVLQKNIYGKEGGYPLVWVIVGVVLFFLASVVEILIPKLTLDIEKKLNPEKQGNVLDFQFRKVWMNSCDEAEQMITYKAGYRAFLNTNVTCLILIVAAFIVSVTFKTDILSLVFVCVIWFVNNLSYMLRAAKLEKRK